MKRREEGNLGNSEETDIIGGDRNGRNGLMDKLEDLEY